MDVIKPSNISVPNFGERSGTLERRQKPSHAVRHREGTQQLESRSETFKNQQGQSTVINPITRMGRLRFKDVTSLAQNYFPFILINFTLHMSVFLACVATCHTHPTDPREGSFQFPGVTEDCQPLCGY